MSPSSQNLKIGSSGEPAFEARTPVESQLISGAAAVIASEVATFGVLTGDLDEAGTVLAHLDRLYDAMGHLQDSDSAWINTSIFYTNRILAIRATGKLKALLVEVAKPGINFGIIRRIARKSGLAGVMVKDIKFLLEKYRAGSVTSDEVWTVYKSRLMWNKSRLETILEAVLPPAG